MDCLFVEKDGLSIEDAAANAVGSQHQPQPHPDKDCLFNDELNSPLPSPTVKVPDDSNHRTGGGERMNEDSLSWAYGERAAEAGWAYATPAANDDGGLEQKIPATKERAGSSNPWSSDGFNRGKCDVSWAYKAPFGSFEEEEKDERAHVFEADSEKNQVDREDSVMKKGQEAAGGINEENKVAKEEVEEDAILTKPSRPKTQTKVGHQVDKTLTPGKLPEDNKVRKQMSFDVTSATSSQHQSLGENMVNETPKLMKQPESHNDGMLVREDIATATPLVDQWYYVTNTIDTPFGPFTSSEMMDWKKRGLFFSSAVWVRNGESGPLCPLSEVDLAAPLRQLRRPARQGPTATHEKGEEKHSKSDVSKAPASEEQRNDFAPPTSLMYQTGGFQGARGVARDVRRWLLVNLQRDSEFSCYQLNRDVWRDELVENLVREGFIFWQSMDDSPEGLTYAKKYAVNAFPHVAIIDPRSGRLMWREEGWTQFDPLTAEKFVELATDFCSSHSFDKLPSERLPNEYSEDERPNDSVPTPPSKSDGEEDTNPQAETEYLWSGKSSGTGVVEEYPGGVEPDPFDEAEAMEESEAVVAVALYNYETFHSLPHGSANVGVLMGSSAGVAGWATCVMDQADASDETASSKRQRSSDMSPPANKKKPTGDGGIADTAAGFRVRRSDEEEARQLRIALLESVGVDVSYKRDKLRVEGQDQDVVYSKDYGDHRNSETSDSEESEWIYEESDDEGEAEDEGEDELTEEFGGDDKGADECVEGHPGFGGTNGKQDESIPTENAMPHQNFGQRKGAVSDEERDWCYLKEEGEGKKTEECVPDEKRNEEQEREAMLPQADRVNETLSRASNQLNDYDSSEDSEGTEDGFSMVRHAPKVNQSSWQWQSIVQQLQNSTDPKKDGHQRNSDKSDDQSDGSSGEWSLV